MIPLRVEYGSFSEGTINDYVKKGIVIGFIPMGCDFEVDHDNMFEAARLAEFLRIEKFVIQYLCLRAIERQDIPDYGFTLKVPKIEGAVNVCLLGNSFDLNLYKARRNEILRLVKEMYQILKNNENTKE